MQGTIEEKLEYAISNRKYVCLTDIHNNVLDKIIPLYYSDNSVKIIFSPNSNVFEFNQIEDVKILEAFPEKTRLVARHSKREHPVSINIDKASYSGVMIDFSLLGVGIKTFELIPQNKIEISKAVLNVFNMQIPARLIYYAKDHSRIGLALEYPDGETLVSRINFYEKYK